MALNFPINLAFRVVALSNQFELIDSQGKCIGYVKQPWTKFKEAVTVWQDDTMETPLYTLKADRILDIAAHYAIATAKGEAIGTLVRKGLKSFVKATYELNLNRGEQWLWQEVNPWSKVFNHLLDSIPIVSLLSSFLFHPRYEVQNASGTPVLALQKKAAWFERKFEIQLLTPLNAADEEAALLSAIMVVLLESHRG